jgi:cytochrome c551/c552
MKRAMVLCTWIMLGGIAFAQNEAALVNEYCAGCHNDKLKSGGFSWSQIDLAHPEQNPDRVERVIRKVRAGMMPPAGAKRPEAATLKQFAAGLEKKVDLAAARQPFIDAPDLHRVNRTEYRNSISKFGSRPARH